MRVEQIMKTDILLCLSFLLFSETIFAQHDCTLKLDRDSVKIWTCPSKNTKYKSVRSTFLMKGYPSQLAALVDGMDWSRLYARDVAQPTATS